MRLCFVVRLGLFYGTWLETCRDSFFVTVLELEITAPVTLSWWYRNIFEGEPSALSPTMEAKRTWDCVQKPFQVIVTLDSAPNDNFLSGFGFISLSLHPPPPRPLLAMLRPKKDLFPHILLKIQLCLGWEGRGR